MREDSNGAKEGLLQWLKLTVLIDKQDAYQFMLRCGQTATVSKLMKEMAQSYDQAVQIKGLFKDRECKHPASPQEKVRNSNVLFLDLTYKEYEAIVKSLFFTKTSIKVHPQPPSGTAEKAFIGQTSTAGIINEEGSVPKQVSKFELDDKVGREQNIQYPQTQPPKKAGVEYMPQEEPLARTNPGSFNITQTQILTSDGLKRTDAVGGNCCALI